MNKGRKQMPTAKVVADISDPTAIALTAQAADVLSATQQQVLEAAEVYRMVGRMEAAQFMETISGRVMAETYLKAKALIGKAGYIAVRFRDGQVGNVSGMDAFCAAVMPVTARRCRQIIAAIDTLGVELYEQAEQIGFRARDYQALRALPNDQQAAVKLAIEAGDLNAAVDIVHELASRNNAMQHKLAEAEKTNAAKDKVIAGKDQKLNHLAEAEERRRNGTPDEKRQAVMVDLQNHTVAAEVAFRQLVGRVAEVMSSAPDEACLLAARQSLDYVARVLVDAAESQNITLDLETDVTPAHMQMFKDIVQASRALTSPPAAPEPAHQPSHCQGAQQHAHRS